ncbi:MAG: Fic family protein [Candidatus Sumerlaeota bacterium]
MSDSTNSRKMGYVWLLDYYRFEAIPNWHESYLASSSVHRLETSGNVVREFYPSARWAGDRPTDQLEFALRYDGINLAILAKVFQKIDEAELVEYIRSKPTGKYTRRAWFLYEYLTDHRLPLDDLHQGNYIDLLEAEEYYTLSARRKIQRQRINDNLPGNKGFCPLVRRSAALKKYEKTNLRSKCNEILSGYSPELLKRALTYLYNKETKSSFEIEHIVPSSTRTARFVSLLHLAEQEDFCEKKRLVELQNRIVDPRFQEDDYRSTQNYVGETITWREERIHYVSPKPDDLRALMAGLLDAHKRMNEGAFPPVIHAAAIAFGFVFLHPFEDGNGRIHRFLIHNILAKRDYTPKGLMFPVSAAMVKEPLEYDASLESFSRPLLSMVEYTIDEKGRMTVHNDTALWYRYIDMTAQAEALYGFIEKTIDNELVNELDFLDHFDKAKKGIQAIVDMPDKMIELFIHLCLQGNGRLSERKRQSHFTQLTDTEIAQMESVIQTHTGTDRRLT